ncbi:hypothetical protein [Spirilliplanes yamanashiensis]|uniref:CU044_5270 family protein n=1 Tax=Spirilliplanes yamanashiensis TaxID=42233 RepID=A0A8J3YEZ4_9ACTN|nr:hypothetical protein [Spirilliplanes yamanashiensis]MDP9815241.1 hypothetical protein [Spirilliplanes yamanashiensis]GIJ06490.1 hypothetical protein Sya03_58420 [Spirilliplanes yamanashiensis]
MPTQDELRNVMNDVAATTEPLSAATVLHAGKRYRNRRRLLAAGGAAAAVLGVVAGIAVLSPGSPDGTTGAGDATAQLRQSVVALQDGNYTFTRTGAYFRQDVARGTIALPDGYLLDHAQGSTVMRAGDNVFLKYVGGGKEQLEQIKAVALPQVPAKDRPKFAEAFTALLGPEWIRTDEKRLTDTAAVTEQSSLDYITQFPSAAQPDVTGADVLIKAVTTAERDGNTITGTLNGTEVDENLGLLGPVDGPDGKTMSYRATLDDQGRLTELTVRPAAPASAPAGPSEPDPDLVITISDYGRTTAPTAPPTSTTLNETGYDLLARDVD